MPNSTFAMLVKPGFFLYISHINYKGMEMVSVTKKHHYPELKIRGDIEDNSKIIFLISE